jgi:hypothetical protein
MSRRHVKPWTSSETFVSIVIRRMSLSVHASMTLVLCAPERAYSSDPQSETSRRSFATSANWMRAIPRLWRAASSGRQADRVLAKFVKPAVSDEK